MVLEEKYFTGFQYVGTDLKLKNTAILCMLEDLAGMHGILAGENLLYSPSVWLLSAYRVNVKRRALYGERLTVRTWARETRNFFACREFEIVDEKGEVIVCAISEWAHVFRDGSGFSKATPELIAAYEAEPERTNFGPFRIKRPKEADAIENEIVYTVGRNYMDANRHMNNVYYLDLAQMVLKDELTDDLCANSFDIFYFKEIKCGDTVRCRVSPVCDGKRTVSVYSEDGSVLHARMVLGINAE